MPARPKGNRRTSRVGGRGTSRTGVGVRAPGRHTPGAARVRAGTADPTTRLSQAVGSLRTIAQTLQHAHQSFADAQLRQPRPEDYEPLVTPLREFARVAPALVEVLSGLARSAAPLGRLAAGEGAAVPNALPISALELSPVGAGRDEVLGYVEAARTAVLGALDDLPQEADYAPVAAQLRELATVSPSLLAWLNEVPKLTAPLRGSVGALRRAAEALEAARSLLVTSRVTSRPR